MFGFKEQKCLVEVRGSPNITCFLIVLDLNFILASEVLHGAALGI